MPLLHAACPYRRTQLNWSARAFCATIDRRIRRGKGRGRKVYLLQRASARAGSRLRRGCRSKPWCSATRRTVLGGSAQLLGAAHSFAASRSWGAGANGLLLSLEAHDCSCNRCGQPGVPCGWPRWAPPSRRGSALVAMDQGLALTADRGVWACTIGQFTFFVGVRLAYGGAAVLPATPGKRRRVVIWESYWHRLVVVAMRSSLSIWGGRPAAECGASPLPRS